MEEKSLKLSPFDKIKFQDWCEIAFVLNGILPRLEFNEGEIWWCYLGMNIGNEQRGKGEEFLRPVVIVKKYNEKHCLIVPLTSKNKEGRHYFTFQFDGARKSTAILSQSHSIDAQRLYEMMGVMKKEDFEALKK